MLNLDAFDQTQQPCFRSGRGLWAPPRRTDESVSATTPTSLVGGISERRALASLVGGWRGVRESTQ